MGLSIRYVEFHRCICVCGIYLVLITQLQVHATVLSSVSAAFAQLLGVLQNSDAERIGHTAGEVSTMAVVEMADTPESDVGSRVRPAALSASSEAERAQLVSGSTQVDAKSRRLRDGSAFATFTPSVPPFPFTFGLMAGPSVPTIIAPPPPAASMPGAFPMAPQPLQQFAAAPIASTFTSGLNWTGFGASGWKCEVCMVFNKESSMNCVSCECEKPVVGFSARGSYRRFGALLKGWRCVVCELENEEGAEKCVACESDKPGMDATTASSTVAWEAGKVVSSEKEWKCDVCCVDNKGAVEKCVACESDKPGTNATKVPSNKMAVPAGGFNWTAAYILPLNSTYSTYPTPTRKTKMNILPLDPFPPANLRQPPILCAINLHIRRHGRRAREGDVMF